MSNVYTINIITHHCSGIKCNNYPKQNHEISFLLLVYPHQSGKKGIHDVWVTASSLGLLTATNNWQDCPLKAHTAYFKKRKNDDWSFFQSFKIMAISFVCISIESSSLVILVSSLHVNSSWKVLLTDGVTSWVSQMWKSFIVVLLHSVPVSYYCTIMCLKDVT